jgi:hypothetical protein
MIHPGIWIYVWQDLPNADALRSYDGALVRAANGNVTKNPSGFDFAANFRRWRDAFGSSRVSPWTYLYPTSDGPTAARTLFNAAGKYDAYQVDLEDAVPAATIRSFCDTLHSLAPGCKLIFDSYPTRHQFINVNGTPGAATWDQAVKSFDAFCPQVYFSSQKDDGWEDEFAGKPITPAFSPANWGAWDYFQANLDRFGSAKLWRYSFTDSWKGKLTYQGGTDLDATEHGWLKDLHDALLTADGADNPIDTASLSFRRLEHGTTLKQATNYNLGDITTRLVALANAVGALTDDESKILAAIANLPPGTLPAGDTVSNEELATALEAAAANLRAT